MRFRKNDRAGLTATSTGVALSLAAGLGLFALISDSVFSTGNSAESGAFDPGDAALAEIALVDAAAGTCDGAVFGTDPVGAAITSSIDLSVSPAQYLGQNDVCIRNASGQSATMTAQYVNVLESEVGPCAANEEAVEGTASCASGDAGELSTVLEQDVFVLEGTCTTHATSAFADIIATAQPLGTIGANATCLLSIGNFLFDGNSDDALAAAQTDRVDWDIVFTLTQDEAPVDANEPNDTTADATPITMTANGAIDPVSDIDVFVYSHTGGTLDAATSTPDCTDAANSDTVLTLLADDGTEITSNDDISTPTDVCSAISQAGLVSGTYFLVVESFDNANLVPQYTLTVSST